MSARAAPSLPKSAPRPGEFISGLYRVDHALGAGGMGYVLAVTRLADGAPLAIKMLNPELSESPRVVARFLHEARAAQAISSEHVTRVFDVGTLPSGAPYLVMERLAGVDLASWLDRERKVPFMQAVDWTLEACEALAEAHSLRYVHRDLKPSNLFLASGLGPGGRPFIKVLDFGIAKSLDAPDHSKLTTTSAIIGSPAYMSPEQLRSSKNVDVHSDIWSLGVLMYELIAGVLPFDAPTLPELSVLILTGKPLPLNAHDPSLPVGLSRVVGACLRRDPAERFGNLAELAHHLAPFGTSLARESAERVMSRLGPPAAPIALFSREELASTMEAPSQPSFPSFASQPSLPRIAPVVTGSSTFEAATISVQHASRRPARLRVFAAVVVALAPVFAGLAALYAWRQHTREPAAAFSMEAGASSAPVRTTASTAASTPPPLPAPPVATAPPSAPTDAARVDASSAGEADAGSAPKAMPAHPATPTRPGKRNPASLFPGPN